MSDETTDRERSVVHREFDPDDCTPETDVAAVVAELEGVDPSELSPLYSTIDDVISNVFSDPPAPEAQVSVTFTYEGYRITIHQDGTAELIKVT